MSDFQILSMENYSSQGGQKKRYKDTLKASLKDFDIPIESWEKAAREWHCLVNKGEIHYEDKRISEAERKHSERKAKTNEPPPN